MLVSFSLNIFDILVSINLPKVIIINQSIKKESNKKEK